MGNSIPVVECARYDEGSIGFVGSFGDREAVRLYRE